MTTETLTVEDRAITAADQAYKAAMGPRDGNDPTECMWAAVFAARDVYEAEVAELRKRLERAEWTVGVYGPGPSY